MINLWDHHVSYYAAIQKEKKHAHYFSSLNNVVYLGVEPTINL